MRHDPLMNRRFVLAAALPLVVALAAAAPHHAAHRAAPAAAPIPLADSVRVVMTTDLGPIEIEL